MAQEGSPGDGDHDWRPERKKRSAPFPTSFFSLIFAVFIAGGLYFGYLFVTAASSLLAVIPNAANIPLLSSNPFQPAAPSSTPADGRPMPTATPLPNWQGTDRVNVLLMGTDQRENERGQPSRTDVMILATFDPVSKTATMLHIPRDLWVVIPGHGENKINTAHFFGEVDRAGGGPQLAKRTIETAFGVRPHYYARVDFLGFEKVIDALGGVTIDVRKAIKDDEYPDSENGTRRIYIPGGPQRMDGGVALQYARSRHSDNDLGRGKRQVEVLLAARKEAMQLDVLPKLPSLLGVLREAVSTDIPATDVLALANLARQIDTRNLVSRAIDSSMFNDLYGDGTVLMPRWDAIRALIADIFADQILKAERATIAIQNGTLRDGLAAAIADTLVSRGFTVQSVAQSSRSDYQETVILDRSGKRYTIQKLADLLAVPTANIRSTPSGAADITVILGQDANIP